MYTVDFAPLYKHGIGFDRMAGLLDNVANSAKTASGYPPYNIEVVEENAYLVEVAVAGFDESELAVNVDSGVLTVRGEKQSSGEKNYLHQGIANRTFERKFNLADHVEVKDAALKNGLLSISLVKELPEAMKPKAIQINSGERATIEDKSQAA